MNSRMQHPGGSSSSHCGSWAKLPKRSWVKISQIRTLAIERLGKKMAKASAEELALIVEGLNEIIGG